MNALLVASGLQHGGPDEARARLERFWKKTSALASRLKPLQTGWALLSTRILSPYEFNPLGLNPLREILEQEVDFAALRRSDLSLLIAATRVRDGQLRIFRNEDVSIDAALASAALPMLHHAIAIDGEFYWDGGYVANPPLIPLATESRVEDLLLVQVLPTTGADQPRTPREINRRLAQMAFTRPLANELDTIAELTRAGGGVLQDGPARKLRRTKLHHIRAEDSVDGLDRLSAREPDWPFLTHLRDAGRVAADRWLAGG
jgi:NTE family protein